MSRSALRSAIVSHDVGTIEKLLDEGADVDDADHDGITSLHIASNRNSSNIVQILISHGASINRRSHERADCFAPLHFAVAKGHKEIVKILLSNNANVNLHAKMRKSPLDIAVESKYVDIAQLLLSHGASVNSPSSIRYTRLHGIWENYQPLHRAIEHGHDELVKLLIDSGADVNADAVTITDIHTGVENGLANEWTPLHIAAEKGYIGITKTLLEHGADVNAGKYGKRMSPLCVAMQEGSSIGCLLEYLDDPDNTKRPTKERKYEIITNLLLDHGAVFVPELDIFQKALHGAVTMGNTTTIQRILKSFPDAIDSFRYARKRDCTLLHTAAGFWNVKLVEFLISHGANVNAEDSHGHTPIFYVVMDKDEILMDARKRRGDDLKTAELLLCNGANVDCRDKNMQTPLHHAVKSCNYEMVNFLVMHNACVESHIESVISPLHVAVEYENAQIVEVLLNNGARINSVCFESCRAASSNLDGPDSDAGSQGSLDHCPSSTSYVFNYPSDREPLLFGHFSGSATPLDCAVIKGHEELVKLLLSKLICADTNSANNSAPMCSAINGGYHRIVKMLLDHGFYIDVSDKEMKKLLFKTVRCRHVKTLEHIFKTYPHVNVIVDNRGCTLLHHAMMYTGLHVMDGVKATEVAELLLKYMCDLNALDDDGNTPLLHALKSIRLYKENYLGMVKYLLEHGAFIDPSDENLQSTIYRFIECDCHKLIELLLKYCSDVKLLLHANGSPLLHTAIELGCTEVARLLIQYGASVNATNKHGQNALHLAIFDPEAVEMLIESGADIDCRDGDGKTAFLKVASPAGGQSSQVMTILLKYGADVNITCSNNFTALDYALKRFQPGDTTRTLITKHFIKMKAANLFVSEHDLQSISSCDSYNDLYTSCKAECEEMRKTKVDHTSLCFYDILTGINYVRNESVAQTLESRDYETKFPLYSDWIKNCFERAQKRVNLLNRIPTASNALLGHELPVDLSVKIFGYLSNFDLQNLIEAYTTDR